MFELLFLIGIVGSIILIPLFLIGVILKFVFKLILFPLGFLGGLIGIGVFGLVFGALALVFGLVVGALGLAGAVVGLGPLLLIALLVAGLVHLFRSGRRNHHPA